MRHGAQGLPGDVTGGIVITVHRVATHSNRPLETPSLKIARAEDNILHRRSNARYNGSANHRHFCRKTFASRHSHSAAHRYFFLRCSSRGGDFSQPLSRSEAVLYSSTVNRNSRETEIHPTPSVRRPRVRPLWVTGRDLAPTISSSLPGAVNWPAIGARITS